MRSNASMQIFLLMVLHKGTEVSFVESGSKDNIPGNWVRIG